MNRSVDKLHMASLCLLLLFQSATLACAGESEIEAGSLKQESSAANPAREFSALADRYFDFSFRADPDFATVLGIHQYDSLAPDLSEQSIKAEIEGLKSFQKQFDSLAGEKLPEQSRIDLELICNHIRAQLLELEEIRSWENNPDLYSSLASSIIYDLISRDFSPLPERLKSVIARQKKIGALLGAGKSNLKNPPRIFCQIALEQMPGIIDFFENSLPEKFKSLEKSDLQAEFQATNREVISQLKSYYRFLQKDLLPRSKGKFALGADLFARKLLYEEMEDSPISLLLERGEAELKRLQQEFIETAREIEPGKSAAQVYADVSGNHTTPDRLLSSMQAVLQELRDFCLKKEIVTIPAPDTLQVKETPPFMRALTFAAMDAPGAFEENSKEAYYYVTLPEPGWKPAQIEEHMRAFCKYDLINTSVHEAFPGHFVQGLWQRQAPSKTTRILECDSNVEGWAHYCEQMVLEEGLLSGKKELKLVVLHDALLRCCRYLVGIKMHTRGMSVQEGISFFMKEGYQESSNAERETRRGTTEPTYLVYTLGKLQLIALREDYKKLKGDRFSLKEFHDRLLAAGAPPMKILRRILLASRG